MSDATGGLPGLGRTVAMECCLDCPFSTLVDPADEDSVWTCTTDWFPGIERTSPAIDAKQLVVGPPPDWCPLRAGPVTLEVRP